MAVRGRIDFDQMRMLAASDPEAFEAYRREVIEGAIARAPARRRERLRCLQWRIEQVREHAANPMAACISLSGMMWEAVTGEQGLQARLNRRAPLTSQEARAAVVPLRPPK